LDAFACGGNFLAGLAGARALQFFAVGDQVFHIGNKLVFGGGFHSHIFAVRLMDSIGEKIPRRNARRRD